MLDFILASGSQSRLELLKSIDCEPKRIYPANIDETPLKKEKPEDYVKRISLNKALSVKNVFKDDNILSADSIIVAKNRIIQKPKDIEELRYFLTLYSGKNIKCYTSVSFIKKDNTNKNKI